MGLVSQYWIELNRGYSLKTIAVIPCLNESQKIAGIVFGLKKLVDMCIVVDDNSSDETVARAKEAGAYVVRRIGKHGFGFTSKVGIKKALNKGGDIIVTLDGDGQHTLSDIHSLLEPIEKGEADVVVGSRFLPESNSIVPRYRKFGIKLITLLYNFGSSKKLSDSQCCIRAFRREVLSTMSISEGGFTFSVESLIKARHMGFRIIEVPVTVIYHKKFSQNSTLNPIRQGLEVAWGAIRVRLQVELLDNIKRLFGGEK